MASASGSGSGGGGRKRRGDNEDDDVRKRERTSEIVSSVQNLDADAAEAKLNELCRTWCLDKPTARFDQLLAKSFSNFGVSVGGDLDLSQHREYGLRHLDEVVNEHEMGAIALYHKLRELEILDDPEKLSRIVRVMECIFYAKRTVFSTFLAKFAVHQSSCADLSLDPDLEARLGSWTLRFRWIEDDMNKVQRVLLHLLDCAMEKRYRKYDGHVYEPITIDGFKTHAWRHVSTMKEFVFKFTQKELYYDQWCNLMSSGSVVKQVCEYLTYSTDFQFQHLIKSRSTFSFTNGVYIAHEDRFYKFGDEPALSDAVVSCRFFDSDCDPHTGIKDWYDIPTPHMQSIMDHQEFPPDVCRWMYILIGRLLYDLNDRDGWQVIPFLKGAAGSGKSTVVLKICKAFYEPVDVGILSNNIERKFGLSAFESKLMFCAPEIKNDLVLEQAEFQSIVSGEDIQVNVKHEKAFSKQWKVPGVLAGNEVPSWADNAGSIQRRLIVFDFQKTVVAGDMKLGEKLQDELPAILVKCNRAYLDASSRWGDKNLWSDLIPSYFKSTRDQIAQAVNSVEAFLASSDVVLGADVYMPFDEFKTALRVHEQMNGYKSTKYTADFFRGPFQKFKLVREKGSREYRGRRLTREYVLGVELVASSTAAGEMSELG